MSRKHKHINRKHQNQADRMAQSIAEYDRYDRDSIINWCLDWMEYFRIHDNMQESAIAFDWADWCQNAPASIFNQMCDQWSAWTAQQTVNSSIYQAELL